MCHCHFFFFSFCFVFFWGFSRSASSLVFASSLKEASGTARQTAAMPDSYLQSGRGHAGMVLHLHSLNYEEAVDRLCERLLLLFLDTRCTPRSCQCARATPIPWLQPARRDECSPRGSDRADLGVAVTHPAPQNNVEKVRNSAG